MPWCDVCDRLVDDQEVVDGHCPTCETELGTGQREPLPWKFRFMIIATVIYLVWRIYQVISWLSR